VAISVAAAVPPAANHVATNSDVDGASAIQVAYAGRDLEQVPEPTRLAAD
jgi:hypothetical protein